MAPFGDICLYKIPPKNSCHVLCIGAIVYVKRVSFDFHNQAKVETWWLAEPAKFVLYLLTERNGLSAFRTKHGRYLKGLTSTRSFIWKHTEKNESGPAASFHFSVLISSTPQEVGVNAASLKPLCHLITAKTSSALTARLHQTH